MLRDYRPVCPPSQSCKGHFSYKLDLRIADLAEVEGRTMPATCKVVMVLLCMHVCVTFTSVYASKFVSL